MRIIDKIKFLFSRPKYELYTFVWMWGNWRIITKISRCWNFNTWFYSLDTYECDVSEGVLNFYKQEQPKEK